MIFTVFECQSRGLLLVLRTLCMKGSFLVVFGCLLSPMGQNSTPVNLHLGRSSTLFRGHSMTNQIGGCCWNLPTNSDVSLPYPTHSSFPTEQQLKTHPCSQDNLHCHCNLP